MSQFATRLEYLDYLLIFLHYLDLIKSNFSIILKTLYSTWSDTYISLINLALFIQKVIFLNPFKSSKHPVNKKQQYITEKIKITESFQF